MTPDYGTGYIFCMNFGDTVTRRGRRVSRSPLRRAAVRVVMRDVPDAFADIALAAQIEAVTLVTPWVTDEEGGCEAFGRVLVWAVTCGARVHLLTRSPSNNEPHRRAIRAVLAAGGRVTTNPDLHAKVFIAEFRNGSRTAAVGSANFTAGSFDLLETSLIIVSPPARKGRDIVDDLLCGPVLRLMRHPDSRTVRTI